MQAYYQKGGSSGSTAKPQGKEPKLGGTPLSKVAFEPEPEPDKRFDFCWYTDLISGQVLKLHGGKVIDGEDEHRANRRFRLVYRVEKVGSELTAAEIADNYDLVVKAKKAELNGIMKHDAMKAVRKAECTTKSITSRWVLTWKMIDGKLGVKAR